MVNNIEIEHKPGTSEEEIKKTEREVRKDMLAKAFGVQRPVIDQWIKEAQGFFLQEEKKARAKGTSTISYSEYINAKQ